VYQAYLACINRKVPPRWVFRAEIGTATDELTSKVMRIAALLGVMMVLHLAIKMVLHLTIIP
jgi:hypothetical protein